MASPMIKPNYSGTNLSHKKYAETVALGCKIFERSKALLHGEYPFFASIQVGLKTVVCTPDNPVTETMATDGKHLWYNPIWVATQTREEIMGVLCHEVLHITQHHNLRKEKRTHGKWNYACDYAINPILKDADIPLPEEALIDEKYSGKAAETIYNLFPKEKEGKEPDDNGDNGCPTKRKERGKGTNKNNEDDDSKFNKVIPGEIKELKNPDNTELSPAQVDQEIQLIQSKIFVAYDTAKQRGKLPGNIAEMVDKMRQPKVDFRTVLRKFIGGGIPDDYSWRRPNKKWLSYDVYMPGTEKFGIGNIVFMFDTSGSVSTPELEQCLAEVNALSTEFNAKSITLIPCDYQVHENAVITYGENNPITTLECTGRGGTSFDPAFDYVEEHNIPCDQAIYFTDMQCRYPRKKPLYPVLWVSTSKTYVKPPFGEVVVADLTKEI